MALSWLCGFHKLFSDFFCPNPSGRASAALAECSVRFPADAFCDSFCFCWIYTPHPLSHFSFDLPFMFFFLAVLFYTSKGNRAALPISSHTFFFVLFYSSHLALVFFFLTSEFADLGGYMCMCVVMVVRFLVCRAGFRSRLCHCWRRRISPSVQQPRTLEGGCI